MIRFLPPTLLVFLLAAPAWAQDTSALDKGEIFVKTKDVAGFDTPKLIVTAVVEAPPAKVYEVVTNCDRFVDRLPRVESSKTLSRNGNSHKCKVRLAMPFPMSDLIAVTVDKRKQGPDEWYRKWVLDPATESESYRHLDGSFVLKPFSGDPNRTLVLYTVHAIPKSAVPDFIRKTAQKKSMPNMIKRIRKEVAKLK